MSRRHGVPELVGDGVPTKAQRGRAPRSELRRSRLRSIEDAGRICGYMLKGSRLVGDTGAETSCAVTSINPRTYL